MSAFQDLYKKGMDRGAHQRQRQKELLRQQKLRRQQEQDGTRSLQKIQSEKPSTSNFNKKQRVAKRNEFPFRPQLSEWLREKPEELSEWMLVPCPVGRRCLVVAYNGKTKVFTKAGYCFQEFKSKLPGDVTQIKYQTVLDCVYVEKEETFYVLDAISFGQQELQECEAVFRFYWLRARFDENDFETIGDHNEKAFVLVDHHDFDNTSAIEETLQKYPLWDGNKPALDGFLFYHKEASYVCATTPLVCWLFAFMVPDVLGLPVSENYAAPDDYQPRQPLEYMNEFDRKLDEQRLQRRKQKKKKVPAMDAENEEQASSSMAQDVPEDDDDSDEFASLKSLLDHERRLELGELDMDCEESPSAVSC
ncbi:snurportin-1 [Drosophila bipectinata]|uniref:snurportin-1 n=1 Tax=Drosophila bipectinata TaxID=42026 RepID=UPI001C8A0D46|nr:snurportin-1 [Drosophila bipectinata]